MLAAPLWFATGRHAAAAETEIAIPRTAPNDPMQSFLRLSNGGKVDAVVDLTAYDAAGAVLRTWRLTVRAGDTVTRLVRGELPADAFARLATIRVIHPAFVLAQHVVGKAPPDNPGAFSVPV
ncbi:MAG: hypothetical protein SFV21_01935 [Rhodospirillaceae bacterium]|nr:hypothetical protein [Rhodospirillaceae bacterium]